VTEENKNAPWVWPDFEKRFHEIREAHKKEAKPAPRPTEDMVVEILNIARGCSGVPKKYCRGYPKREPAPPDA
jgi:hypothetical protein